MAKPSEKASTLERILEAVAGRTTAIESDHCISPPIGCGEPAPPDSFRTPLDVREYSISGLCQACQDSIFGQADGDD
jgi:hypothetical protein